MKRFLACVFVGMCACTVALAIYTSGWGTSQTVTGTATLVQNIDVGSLSIFNGGGAAVYCLVNTSANDFSAAYTAGRVVIIPGGMSFTFNGQGKATIRTLCIQTAGATNICYLAGF